MKRLALLAFAGVAAGLAHTAPAAADTLLNRGHLGQYCAATHGPRGVQTSPERVGYNRYGQAEAVCRLVGAPYGYTLNNEAVDALCRFVGEAGPYRRGNGGVVCVSAPATAPASFQPIPYWRNPLVLGRVCVRTPTGFRCR